MPWTANNNQAGEIRAPAITAALRQKQRLAGDPSLLRTYSQTLCVAALEDVPDVDVAAIRYCALLHPDDFPAIELSGDKADAATREEFIYPRQHAQFVVPVRTHAGVARGHVALSQVQAINLELCIGQVETWTLFQEPSPRIDAIAIEIRPLVPLSATARIETDAPAFARAFASFTHAHVLTENERLVVPFDGREYFVRVLCVDAPDASETDFTMPDSFRGTLDAHATRVAVSADVPDGDKRFVLTGSTDTDTAPPNPLRSDVVLVCTNDDEEFPVKKKLLFPCIALSSAVLAGHGVHKDSSTRIHVDVDCLTFDRVLRYLEHEARDEPSETFQFDPAHTEELLTAATTLGCSGLEDVCKLRLGEFATRVRPDAIRWDEVVRRNTHGEVWLVMLGMVFDVTRWLPEHPGGSVIIPEQAVNVDCTVMFEIYHSSRQSFRYLKQFYIGELEPTDLSRVPQSTESPSPAFIQELEQVRRSLSTTLAG